MTSSSNPELPHVQQSPNTIDQQFRQAVDLAQRGRRGQALQLFEGCLELAAREHTPLSLEQLASILQEIAWCYGDMGRREEALRIYKQVEQILHQAPGWRSAVPPELNIVVAERYDPLPRLAALYESLGIAYDNAGDMEQALEYYQRAIAGYMRLENSPKAATVWHHIALGYQHRDDWRNLQYAAEQMLTLWTQTEGMYGQVWAWQYLAQAHANQGHLEQAVASMERAVQAERCLKHRDLARDEALLAELRRALERKKQGIVARLLRTGAFSYFKLCIARRLSRNSKLKT